MVQNDNISQSFVHSVGEVTLSAHINNKARCTFMQNTLGKQQLEALPWRQFSQLS